ncbi:MAG: hypothetical protein AMS21_12380 [Gemmatimonas sp. SG8_38_2]|nr:MAG: hypothetical protein AMS21_12380 [Gemmatimonas sp. SG8_38_2]
MVFSELILEALEDAAGGVVATSITLSLMAMIGFQGLLRGVWSLWQNAPGGALRGTRWAIPLRHGPEAPVLFVTSSVHPRR